MKLRELLKSLAGYTLDGNEEIEITSITADSRRVEPGGLFFALRGTKTDGHLHIDQATAAGAAAILLENSASAPVGTAWIKVDDSRAAMGEIASVFNGNPTASAPLIGITGTNGKTTTTYILEGILTAACLHPAVLGTINYRLGDKTFQASHTTPEATELQSTLRELRDAGADAFVMEVSSHALEQKRVAGCQYDVGIFSNLTRDHLDYHLTMENYREAKTTLFSELLRPSEIKPRRRAVINMDDPSGVIIAAASAAPVISYGLSAAYDVHPVGIISTVSGISGTIVTPSGSFEFRSRLLGRFNLYNILAAAAAGFGLELPLAAIKSGIEKHAVVPGRMERVDNNRSITCLVDYAHTGDALLNVLSTLKEISTGRIITLFGCGGDRDNGKRPIMGEIAAGASDLAIVTSDNPRTEEPGIILEQIKGGITPLSLHEYNLKELENGFSERGFIIVENRREAIKVAASVARYGDIVLIAGKGHEDYQIIGTIRHHFDDREEATAAFNERLSPMFTAEEIAQATGGRVIGPQGRTAVAVSSDSRSVIHGQLFVPLRGSYFDGHSFINDVTEKGVSLVLAEEQWLKKHGIPSDLTCIAVKNTLHALGDIAAAWRRQFDLPVIAVTGSNGKTTVKEMLASVLKQTSPGLKTYGNLNNLIGLPQMLLQLKPEHRWAVLEMGMSEPGEIDRLASIASPRVGIVLNAMQAHLQSMGTVEAIAAAKGELLHRISDNGLAVVNADDPRIASLPQNPSARRISFGIDRGVVRAREIETLGLSGQRFVMATPRGEVTVHLKAMGRHNIYNALAVAAALLEKVEMPLIVSGLESFNPYKGRFATETIGGFTLIDDSYNANPSSMKAALETLAEIAGSAQRIAVLGDMFELGSYENEAHFAIGSVAAKNVDYLCLVGERMKKHALEGALQQGMPEGAIFCCGSQSEAAAVVSRTVRDGAAILVKGSRGMAMERVLSGLKELLLQERAATTL